MTQFHRSAQFYQGDTWKIDGELVNASGEPLPLADALLEWKLVDSEGATMITITEVQVLDVPSATIRITVSSTLTAQLEPGEYQDYLRVTLSDTDPDMLWAGTIEVRFSPFA